jgi:hypothetical protein
MIIGGGLFAVFRIFTWIYNLPTKNNWLATVGLLLLIPVFVGLFIYGKRLKEYNYSRGIVLQYVSILSIVAFIITSIINFV